MYLKKKKKQKRNNFNSKYKESEYLSRFSQITALYSLIYIYIIIPFYVNQICNYVNLF